MILYDYPIAPNPMRVNLFLYEKKLDISRKFVDLRKSENLSKSFLKINPWGTLPVLIYKKEKIAETMAICKLMESLKPKPYLFGKSPIEQAKIEMYRRKIEFDGFFSVGEAFRNSAKAFKNRAIPGSLKIPQIPDLVERGKARTIAFMIFLDDLLKRKKFLIGNKFTVLDIEAYTVLHFATWIKIDGKKKKNIRKWSETLENRPAFKKYFNLINK
tara:strand:+ start:15 stop:659 length:645 start_codon:yes stop_codon:yes gene_type:complete